MFQTVENPTPPAETNHRKASCVHLQRWPRLPSALTFERLVFLLIHCAIYLLLFVIIFVRLENVSQKQDFLITIFRHKTNSPHLSSSSSSSSSSPSTLFVPSANFSTSNENCSCSTVIASPQHNRTTKCLEVRVGSERIGNVFCPTNGRGETRAWFRIQQRQSNSFDFNRTWYDYRRGFGDVTHQIDFWIGNENLHWLTNTYPCRLKIELTDWYNETRTAIYETFHVSNILDGYRLHLNNYHGDMDISSKIDTFTLRHNKARFSTYDHYATTTNCPGLFGGAGWWYYSGQECAHVQLNGRIASHFDGLVPLNTGIIWLGWKPDRHYSYQRVVMSIQPKSRRSRPASSSSSSH